MPPPLRSMDTHEAKLITALSRWFQEEDLREAVFDAAWPQSFFQSVHDSRVVHLALADRQVIPHAWLGLTIIIDIRRRLSYDLWGTGGLIQRADNDWTVIDAELDRTVARATHPVI